MCSYKWVQVTLCDIVVDHPIRGFFSSSKSLVNWAVSAFVIEASNVAVIVHASYDRRVQQFIGKIFKYLIDFDCVLKIWCHTWHLLFYTSLSILLSFRISWKDPIALNSRMRFFSLIGCLMITLLMYRDHICTLLFRRNHIFLVYDIVV